MFQVIFYNSNLLSQDVTSQQRKFGVCFIDTSLGVFHMCEFEDDKHCSKLLVCLSEYPPGLVRTVTL
jgi:DNA mismatch repair protein MSH6